MSFTKDLLESGLRWRAPEKFVCADCVDDDVLKDVVEAHAERTACDYCGSEKEGPIAAPIDELAVVILEGLESEYEDPANCLPFESAEGGYQGVVQSSLDLLLFDEPFTCREDLATDVASLIDLSWTQKHPFSLRRREAMAFGWEDFSHLVKHKTRFLFFEEPPADPWYREEEVGPTRMLDTIGDVAREVGLIRKVPPGECFVRARPDDPGVHHDSAEQLGPPPVESAVSPNRMSPAGIPLFYGARDDGTAIEEVRSNDPRPRVATLGTWKAVREFQILDLTDLPYVPSLYDEQRRHLRDPIMFLWRFVDEVSKPIGRNQVEHIEYVPTQVVTEYFRFRFRDQDGERIHGIAYPSSRKQGGVSYVLFLDQENCADSTECVVPRPEVYLALLVDSVRRVTLVP